MKAWPKDYGDDVYTHTVHYCYQNKEAEEKLQTVVDAGIKLWETKIGEAGKTNGHALKIVKNKDKQRSPYCFEDDGGWNDLHPEGSLMIHLYYGTFWSTMGYTPDPDGKLDIDRHQMALDPDLIHKQPSAEGVVAHELGKSSYATLETTD